MPVSPIQNHDHQPEPAGGAQRLSLEKLRAWEALQYGMFIHFGMSTYDGDEFSMGDKPSTLYAPDKLDVDQWIQVARDAGMKYAVLTTKHVAGHCLWPSKHTDYHVGTSGNTTDVVEAFVKACDKHGIMPGFYYCSWDNHHLLGSITPTLCNGKVGIEAFTTQAYRDFQMAQVEELLTQYGPVGEMWVDIPKVLGHDGRRQQYDQIVSLCPGAIILMNHGISDGSHLDLNKAWPTDLMPIERFMPNSAGGYFRWWRFAMTGRFHRPSQFSEPVHSTDAEQDYYIPAEVCDPIAGEWFHVDGDRLRSVRELMGMRLICLERRANLLLDVPPDRSGRIPDATVRRLMELRRALETFNA